jgi:hypothetical protein
VQIFFNRVASCRARSIFFSFLLTGHFLCWAFRLFFFCLLPLSSVCARQFFLFVLSGRFSTALSARQNFFIWGLSGRILLHAQNLFLVVSGQLLLCMQKFFSLSDRSLLHSRLGAMPQTFSLCSVTSPHSHACVSGAPAIFFCPVASGQQQLRAQFFFVFCHSHTLLPCAQPFVLVTGRCVTRAARKLFFCHFRAAV